MRSTPTGGHRLGGLPPRRSRSSMPGGEVGYAVPSGPAYHASHSGEKLFRVVSGGRHGHRRTLGDRFLEGEKPMEG